MPSTRTRSAERKSHARVARTLCGHDRQCTPTTVSLGVLRHIGLDAKEREFGDRLTGSRLSPAIPVPAHPSQVASYAKSDSVGKVRREASCCLVEEPRYRRGIGHSEREWCEGVRRKKPRFDSARYPGQTGELAHREEASPQGLLRICISFNGIGEGTKGASAKLRYPLAASYQEGCSANLLSSTESN